MQDSDTNTDTPNIDPSEMVKGIIENLSDRIGSLDPAKHPALLARTPAVKNPEATLRKFMPWLLADANDGLIRYAITDDVRQGIERVAKLFAESCTDGKLWESAADAVGNAGACDGRNKPGSIPAYHAAKSAAFAALFLPDVFIFEASCAPANVASSAAEEAGDDDPDAASETAAAAATAKMWEKLIAVMSES